MDMKSKVVGFIKKYSDKPMVNKYTLTVFAFVVWISFFDKYRLSTQLDLSQTVNKLEEQKIDYEKKLEEAIVERNTINSDIEKYGREKYLFHKDGEEVILIK